jgi:hypothetical protein
MKRPRLKRQPQIAVGEVERFRDELPQDQARGRIAPDDGCHAGGDFGKISRKTKVSARSAQKVEVAANRGCLDQRSSSCANET